MTSPNLIPLICIKCQTPLPAKPDEIAWICPQCGQGHILDESNIHGLSSLNIEFDSSIKPGARGRPFWVSTGHVVIKRETYKGNHGRDAALFWKDPRKFFVPAFTCSLDDLVSWGMHLMRQPPELDPGPLVQFLPVSLQSDDVFALAEFIVLGIEADRRDQLKEVQFQLDLEKPSLWILP